jgi:hypothetical protein
MSTNIQKYAYFGVLVALVAVIFGIAAAAERWYTIEVGHIQDISFERLTFIVQNRFESEYIHNRHYINGI